MTTFLDEHMSSGEVAVSGEETQMTRKSPVIFIIFFLIKGSRHLSWWPRARPPGLRLARTFPLSPRGSLSAPQTPYSPSTSSGSPGPGLQSLFFRREKLSPPKDPVSFNCRLQVSGSRPRGLRAEGVGHFLPLFNKAGKEAARGIARQLRECGALAPWETPPRRIIGGSSWLGRTGWGHIFFFFLWPFTGARYLQRI